MDEIMTYKEVAQRLKVSERTVWGWVKKGKLKACKLAGRSVRITEQSLRDFVNNAKTI